MISITSLQFYFIMLLSGNVVWYNCMG